MKYEIGIKIKRLRESKGISQKKLASQLGVSSSRLSNWEQGINRPDVDILSAICEALDVSADKLLDVTPSPMISALSADRIWGEAILDAYAKITEGKQIAVCAVLDIDYIKPSEAEPDTAPFRISEQPAAAGTGVYLGPESFYEVYINVNKLPRNAIFGIPIQGNSMEPRFHDGEVVVVTKDEPRIGEIGVFTMEGQGYLKQLGKDELISLNGRYNPIPMDESIRCNGKVVGILQEEWIVG